MKRRTGWLVVIGLCALLLSILATLPAGLLASPLRRAGLEATAFGGSVWSGRASALALRGALLGDLDWTLAPGQLLRGRAVGHLRLVRAYGGLETDYDVALTGRDVHLSGLQFALPIELLTALPLGLPAGWRGQASGQLVDVRLEQGWPTTLRGTLDLDGLYAPPPRNAPLGSFHVVFPHPAPQASLSVPVDPSNVTAQVVDKEGPYAVEAQFTLNRSRAFALEGALAARGEVPAAMRQSLEMLGPADAAGRRQFSIGGTL
ncbi:MAG TPA: type II secretion system protein N [Steroidobacteraceae bacterium]